MNRMRLANFTAQDPGAQCPFGACEVGGHPARATLDRPLPDSLAKITVQFVHDGMGFPRLCGDRPDGGFAGPALHRVPPPVRG